MGLLATLPRATRGHLGAANNSLTRATRGYLQKLEVVVVRRPGGGLFAPELELEVEFFRHHTSVLQIHMDGASDFSFRGLDDGAEILTGRLWLNGQSKIRLSSGASVPLKVVTLPRATHTPLRTTPKLPEPPRPRRSFVNVEHRRVTGTAGVVVAMHSTIRVGKAPRPTFAQSQGGALWFDGGSRFRAFDLGLPQHKRTNQDIAMIAAMLAEMLDD